MAGTGVMIVRPYRHQNAFPEKVSELLSSLLIDCLLASAWQGLMTPLMIGAVQPGKAFTKIRASQVFLDYLVVDGVRESMLSIPCSLVRLGNLPRRRT